MEYDDDAPPDLIETTEIIDGEEEKPVKVPITIVTGLLSTTNLILLVDLY